MKRPDCEWPTLDAQTWRNSIKEHLRNTRDGQQIPLHRCYLFTPRGITLTIAEADHPVCSPAATSIAPMGRPTRSGAASMRDPHSRSRHTCKVDEWSIAQ